MRILPLVLAALPLTAQAEPLTVITDIPPVQSLVMQVTGDRGTVDVLLEPNADPHHFQMRPSQGRRLANADFLIWIGEDMTPWLERARGGLAADLPHLALLDALEGEEHGEDHEDDHDQEDDHDDHDDDDGHEDDHSDHEAHEDDHADDDVDEHDGHDHHGVDPHVWLDTHLAEEMLHLIADHLAELDPEGSEIYEHNAHEAIETINELTHEIERTLAGVANVPFVVTHEGYNFLVEQFGLNQVGSLKDVSDSPASAGNVSDLTHEAQDGHIACVFGEVGESNKLADVLVEQGVKRGRDLDPAGISLERGPKLYQDLIRNMANSLKTCLAE